MNTLRDAYGPLLRLDNRDRAGLTRCKHRARFWLTALKRRRKYGLPAGEPFTPEESALIEALADLETLASKLLALADEKGQQKERERLP